MADILVNIGKPKKVLTDWGGWWIISGGALVIKIVQDSIIKKRFRSG
jgi:hypothetical protein